MANVKIYGDIESGSMFFVNSTVDPKALGTIVATKVIVSGQERVKIERNDRFQEDKVSFRVLFAKMNPNRIRNRGGDELVATLGYTTDQVVAYINEQNALTGSGGGDGSGNDLTGIVVDFKLDATSTSIMLDNGYEYGVNTIKAVSDADGTIHIVSEIGSLTHYTLLDHTNVTVNGSSVAGGINDVINVLNELFTVGAFEQVVIADPYSTLIADVGGVDSAGSLVGANAIDPSSDDIGGSTLTHYNKAGWLSTDTIDQAGEYFTFDIRHEGIIGMGLVLDDVADVYGNATYGDPANFCTYNSSSGNYGYQFAHFFHPSPDGPWTNYGAAAGVVYGSGWNGSNAFRYSDEGQDWKDGNPVKMKVGIDDNSFIAISYWDSSESAWVLCARTNYPVGEGVKFKLGIKFCDTVVRLYSTPKAHLLVAAAPTLTFRYIESPDANYEYPLFATEEEANYYDLNHGGTVGTGTSHTHTYVDDPTSTTWYMADTGSEMTGATIPTGIFMSTAINYTEITSQTNADLTPAAFTFNDLMYQELTTVNLQLYPAGASFTQSVSIDVMGSGLVYNNTSGYLQGTLTDVGADTVYTLTVTRANSYGSTMTTFTITSTDETVVSSLTTPWDKAVVVNGANEYLMQVSNSNSFNILNMGGMNNDVWGANNGKTSTDTDARPWSISQVVYIDNSQPQCYFSQAENYVNDRISLSTHETGANSKIEFYWGRSTGTNGANSNGCQFLFDKPADGWYGYYIDTTGFRPNQAQSTTTALADNFRFKQVDLSTGTVTDITGTWTIVGDGRLNRGLNGDFYIGRESGSQSFNSNSSLKVASTLISTLKRDFLLPNDTEISMQVRDPQQWVIDYRDGTQQRLAYNNTPYAFDTYPERCVSLWLMGDGSLDSYSNNLRNDVKTSDQNYTMLRLQNMVSNDIVNVSITGLS